MEINFTQFIAPGLGLQISIFNLKYSEEASLALKSRLPAVKTNVLSADNIDAFDHNKIIKQI